MRQFLIISVVLAVCFLAVPGHAESIYNLIKKGDRQAALKEISQQTTAQTRDGNILFYQALLEREATNAVKKLEAALNASVAPIYREEIAYLLAQYYFMNKNYNKLEDLVTRYRTDWENGEYRAVMKRYSVFIDEYKKSYNAAIKQIDRYLMEYDDGEEYQFGSLDKARIMASFNKSIGAYNLLRALSREKKGEGVPQALYLLADRAVKKKNTDDAVFFYNVLREGYPAAIGLDATISKMELLTPSGDRSSQAEQITGTYYSVKVGVFSNKGNAQRHADSFKLHNHKVEIEKKKISGKSYQVVYVGRFKTYQDAYALKTTLDQRHNEVFQVVAR